MADALLHPFLRCGIRYVPTPLSKNLRLTCVPPSMWRGPGVKMHPNWKNIRKDILDRTDHTCAFCGFPAGHYRKEMFSRWGTQPDRWPLPSVTARILYRFVWLDVHHYAGTWWDDSPENLVPVCQLCHSCLHIGLAGTRETMQVASLKRPHDAPSGPYCTQTAINHCFQVHMLFAVAGAKGWDLGEERSRNMVIRPFLGLYDLQEEYGPGGLLELSSVLCNRYDNTGTLPEAPDTWRAFPYRLQSFVQD